MARTKKAAASNAENDFRTRQPEVLPVTIAARGYLNKHKNYTKDSEMFEELITNQFFAPNVKNIRMEFNTDENGGTFCFINDGSPMTKAQMRDAVTVIGCESAHTAGNENGTGIKSAAAYSTIHSKDSVLVVVSKKKGKVVDCYALNNKGECRSYSACNKHQQEFIDWVVDKFENGTATAAYDVQISKSEVLDFIYNIPYMFTTGVDKVNFTYTLDSDDEVKIEPFDRLYSHLNDRIKNTWTGDKEVLPLTKDVSFKHTVKITKNGNIEYRTRKFICTYKALFMNTIVENDSLGKKYLEPHRDKILQNDEDYAATYYKDYGVHIGYDNGYMPIHISNVESIGQIRHPRWNHFRASIIAHPVEEGEMYYDYDENNEKVLVENCSSVAGVEEWQAFISEIGNVNEQKVPNLSRRKHYMMSEKSKTPKKCWEGFYYAILADLISFANKCKPDTDYVKKADKYKDSELEKANKHLQKLDFDHFGAKWKFRFAKNLGTKTVKYEKANKTILFNFTEKSELNKKLLNGGRKGRNGSTDLYVSIEPIIDVFKMNITARTNHTSADIEKSIRVTRDRFNDYYTTEDED